MNDLTGAKENDDGRTVALDWRMGGQTDRERERCCLHLS
jgi:hypothetical protein